MTTPRKSDPKSSQPLTQRFAQRSPSKASSKTSARTSHSLDRRSPGRAHKSIKDPLQQSSLGRSRSASHPGALSKPWAKLVLKQAQRGNPKAITTLLRQQLKRHHPDSRIRVQVVRKNSTLLVHLTGAVAPGHNAVMAWAKPFFSKLSVAGITGARLLGHRSGLSQAVWTEQISMTPSRSSLSTPLILGTVFAGGTLLVLAWGIGAMVRGPSESVAQAEAQSEEQVAASEQAAADAEPAEPKPDYRVIREEIFDGRRIQIDTNDPDLSRDECIAIAAKFLEEAGTDGKVVVQKPNPKPPWNGKRAPFCANNNNGYGTFFNSEYF